MALLEISLIVLGIVILAFIIAALPLYFAVKILGGKTGLFKAILVNILAGLIVIIITPIFKYGGLVAFLLLVLVYREFFKLKWWKAFIVWLVEIIVVVIMIVIFATISGIGLAFLLI